MACSQRFAFSTHLSWSTLAVFRVPRQTPPEECWDSSVCTSAAKDSHLRPSDGMFELVVDKIESTLAAGPEITTIPRVHRSMQSSVPSPLQPHLPLFIRRFALDVYEAVTLTHLDPQPESRVSVKSPCVVSCLGQRARGAPAKPALW